jgi:transposase
MAYSSSLTDKEWELLEPLLSEVLPKNKPDLRWTKRELLDGVLYQLKMAVTGKTYPKTYSPYSTVYWQNNGVQGSIERN